MFEILHSDPLARRLAVMERSPTDIEQLAQAINDLETLLREELVMLQYEIIGTRDALSEEMTAHLKELQRQIRLLRH